MSVMRFGSTGLAKYSMCDTPHLCEHLQTAMALALLTVVLAGSRKQSFYIFERTERTHVCSTSEEEKKTIVAILVGHLFVCDTVWPELTAGPQPQPPGSWNCSHKRPYRIGMFLQLQ